MHNIGDSKQSNLVIIAKISKHNVLAYFITMVIYISIKYEIQFSDNAKLMIKQLCLLLAVTIIPLHQCRCVENSLKLLKKPQNFLI